MNQTTPSTTITLSKPLKVEHMRVCQRVASVYDECMNAAGEYVFKDLRNDGANPHGARTTEGLFLVFHGKAPARLWTPWGAWHFAGTAVVEPQDYSAFLMRMTLVERTSIGTGWVYDLLAIDGEEVPADPVLATDRLGHYEALALQQEWKELYRSC